MNTEKTLDRLRTELDEWTARIEALRVRANLGGKEVRDKLQELDQRLEPARDEAKRLLDELAKSGADEARTLGKSLLAGWDELRRTHHELKQQAEKKPKG